MRFMDLAHAFSFFDYLSAYFEIKGRGICFLPPDNSLIFYLVAGMLVFSRQASTRVVGCDCSGYTGIIRDERHFMGGMPRSDGAGGDQPEPSISTKALKSRLSKDPAMSCCMTVSASNGVRGPLDGVEEVRV
ncbi:MAG: hypothetical protein WBM23_06060, partial [Desulfomonilia bacterium]